MDRKDGPEGKSRFRTRYKNAKVNDEVEFKWMDIKKMKNK